MQSNTLEQKVRKKVSKKVKLHVKNYSQGTFYSKVKNNQALRFTMIFLDFS